MKAALCLIAGMTVSGSNLHAQEAYPISIPVPAGSPAPVYKRWRVLSRDDVKLVVHEWAPARPHAGQAGRSVSSRHRHARRTVSLHRRRLHVAGHFIPRPGPARARPLRGHARRTRAARRSPRRHRRRHGLDSQALSRCAGGAAGRQHGRRDRR